MGSSASGPHNGGSQDSGSRRPAAVTSPSEHCKRKEIPKGRNPGSIWEGFSVVNGQCVEGFASEGAESPFPFRDRDACVRALNSGHCG